MLTLLFPVDTVVRSSLGGGLWRHMRNAGHLRRCGIATEFVALKCDLEPAFQEAMGFAVHVPRISSDLDLGRQRSALLKACYHRAAELPAGQRLVATDSCRNQWDTSAQVWRARWAGIPSYHGTSMYPGPMPASLRASLNLKLVAGSHFHGLKCILAQTEATARLLRSYFYLRRSKVQVLGNGVDCDQFQPVSAEQKRSLRVRLGLPAAGPIVLSVASVVPRKGINLLIKAWPAVLQSFPDATLVIAGSIGRRATFMDQGGQLDDYSRMIESLIAALPRPESVVLTRAEVTNVADYYQAADAFSLASEREGLPNVVLEAMACALPCVLTRYAGFPEDGEELGVEDRHFVAAERNEADLARAIAGVLTGRPEMGPQAREWMLQHQSKAVIMDRLGAALHRIARQ